jgi:hypothetical protein
MNGRNLIAAAVVLAAAFLGGHADAAARIAVAGAVAPYAAGTAAGAVPGELAMLLWGPLLALVFASAAWLIVPVALQRLRSAKHSGAVRSANGTAPARREHRLSLPDARPATEP